MAITKETTIDKIEIINTVNIQVREIITVKEDGNIIYAYNSNTDIPKKKLKIKSDKVEYIKSEKRIIFKENHLFCSS